MPLDRTSNATLDDEAPPAVPPLPPLPEALRNRIAECRSLPSLPAAAAQVILLARASEPRLDELARAIEQDPALTLRLLSLANSALYHRGSGPITTCRDAVSRLGLDVTMAAALSFALPPPGEARLAWLWQRAIIAALAAQQLAQRLAPTQSGTLFTTALIQDIGILVLDALDGERYRQRLPEPWSHDALSASEQLHYGCDHALVGAWLALGWGIPSHLATGIAESHGPLEESDTSRFCLRLSCRIAETWLLPDPTQAFSELIHQLEPSTILDATQLVELLEGLEEKLPPLARLFELTCPPSLDSRALQLEARKLLSEQNLRLSSRLAEQQRELDALMASHKVLDRQRRTDHLTQLANRSWLERQLAAQFESARAAGQPLAVMFIDLDHFKEINDLHGHPFGDRVLVQFSGLLKQVARESDVIGRYGGEEFLIIMPQSEHDQASALADEIRQQLAQRPLAHVDAQPLHVTASIGIATLDDGDFSSIGALIDAADQAMYAVKRCGRDGVAQYQA